MQQAQRQAPNQDAPKRRSSMEEGHGSSASQEQGGPGRVLIILRGLPGSGKSWLARRVVTSNPEIDAKVCTQAIYHWSSMEVGVGTKKYNPNSKRLCLESIFRAMDSGYRLIIVDDVNALKSDYDDAVAEAQRRNYQIRIVEYQTKNPQDLACIKARRNLVPYVVDQNFPGPKMTFDQEWDYYNRVWEADPRAEITPPEMPTAQGAQY